MDLTHANRASLQCGAKCSQDKMPKGTLAHLDGYGRWAEGSVTELYDSMILKSTDNFFCLSQCFCSAIIVNHLESFLYAF